MFSCCYISYIIQVSLISSQTVAGQKNRKMKKKKLLKIFLSPAP